ncbi:MAG: hypothetical protein ACR65O_03470 [Methylomicrobium sp.]
MPQPGAKRQHPDSLRRPPLCAAYHGSLPKLQGCASPPRFASLRGAPLQSGARRREDAHRGGRVQPKETTGAPARGAAARGSKTGKTAQNRENQGNPC